MAWTAPVTFVNGVLPASQLNQMLRDNMNETAPAKASMIAGYFASSGTNSIAEREVLSTSFYERFGSISTTYSAVAGSTGGGIRIPNVAHSGSLIALWTSRLYVWSGVALGNAARVSCEVTGKTSASDSWAISTDGDDTNAIRGMGFNYFSGLGASTSDQVRMMFRVGSGQANFSNCELIVFPL
jgi:hypothetical protein